VFDGSGTDGISERVTFNKTVAVLETLFLRVVATGMIVGVIFSAISAGNAAALVTRFRLESICEPSRCYVAEKPQIECYESRGSSAVSAVGGQIAADVLPFQALPGILERIPAGDRSAAEANGMLGRFARMRFEFAEGKFDWIEVGRILRELDQRRARRLDCRRDADDPYAPADCS
jgi:hypothetical protein